MAPGLGVVVCEVAVWLAVGDWFEDMLIQGYEHGTRKGPGSRGQYLGAGCGIMSLRPDQDMLIQSYEHGAWQRSITLNELTQ
jgi:hypothetical protein